MSDLWKNKSVDGRPPSAGWLVGGKMGNLARSDLIRARHYNQLQFNIPGLPTRSPPHQDGRDQKLRQNVMIKNRDFMEKMKKWICKIFDVL